MIATDSIRLKIFSHASERHYIAVSDDVDGFIAQGRSFDELIARIPKLMKALLASRGEDVEQTEFSVHASESPVFETILRVFRKPTLSSQGMPSMTFVSDISLVSSSSVETLNPA